MAELKDLEIIRRTVARELETITQYEQDAAAATDERVRTFLSHLAHEEKEHVAEGMAMLALLDDRQAALQEKGAHFLEEASAAATPTDATQPTTEPTGAAAESAGVGRPPREPEPAEVPALFRRIHELTVGDLKRQRRASDPVTPHAAHGPNRPKR